MRAAPGVQRIGEMLIPLVAVAVLLTELEIVFLQFIGRIVMGGATVLRRDSRC